MQPTEICTLLILNHDSRVNISKAVPESISLYTLRDGIITRQVEPYIEDFTLIAPHSSEKYILFYRTLSSTAQSVTVPAEAAKTIL